MIGASLFSRLKNSLFIFALFLLFAFLGDPEGQFTAPVRRVIDGDTVVVVGPEGSLRTLRLWAIDAPELTQPHGPHAKRALQSLVSDIDVQVQLEGQDSFGRDVAALRTPSGRSINHALVRQGHAWHYRSFAPLQVRLWILHAYARLRGNGLWATPGRPIPPWDWR